MDSAAEVSMGILLLERPETAKPTDPFDIVARNARDKLFEQYKGDQSKLGVVRFAFELFPALRGSSGKDPFPLKTDTDGIKRLVRIQKDLIRLMVGTTQGGTSAQDLRDLNDLYTIAGVIELCSKEGEVDPKHPSSSNNARSWWNGIKAEAALTSSLQWADFDVAIPEVDEVIDVDYHGGVDFLAARGGRVFAIDAKSNAGMKDDYMVLDNSLKPVTPAVGSLSSRHFSDFPITQATIVVNPRHLPALPREDNPKKQLTAFRNFLTLPENVEQGIINSLSTLPPPIPIP